MCEPALANNWRIDSFAIPLGPAPDDGVIFFGNLVRLHRQPELACRSGRFRDQHDAARFPIETIDDRNLSAICDFERKQLAQFRPERPSTVWLAWVDQQLSRFIDNDIIVRLINYCEIATGLRLGVARLG